MHRGNGNVQLKGTSTLWRSRSDPSDPSSLHAQAVPLCFELRVSNQTDWCWGPFDTRGPLLLQILVGQLAASQETYFNYHKSLGLFPFILFFNGLCMYHLMQMTYRKVLSFLCCCFSECSPLCLRPCMCLCLCTLVSWCEWD